MIELTSRYVACTAVNTIREYVLMLAFWQAFPVSLSRSASLVREPSTAWWECRRVEGHICVATRQTTDRLIAVERVCKLNKVVLVADVIWTSVVFGVRVDITVVVHSETSSLLLF